MLKEYEQSTAKMQLTDAIYIEDDDQEALLMQIGMRRRGVNILHVPYITVDTLDELSQPPYDQAVAVIFDEMLVGESGVKLANALRANGDQRLIFLLTAGDNPDPRLLTTQSILFRRKPANLEELANTILKLGRL